MTFSDGLFMNRISIGVEKTNGNSVDGGLFEALYDTVEPVPIDGLQHLSGMDHSLIRLETQVAWDQWIGTANAPVVEVGPVLPADLQDVTESRGNDQRCLRTTSLEERVRSYCRAVYEEIDPVRRNGVPTP